MAAVIDGRGDAVADWASGVKPRWSDLPHLAGIVGRAYGSPLGRMRLVGGGGRFPGSTCCGRPAGS